MNGFEPGEPGGDPFGGRRPTSHERVTGQPWDASYHEGPPPWDIGRPQPMIARLAAEGAFAGDVLDAGCGTGENTLLIAEHVGETVDSVLGVDVAETALELARTNAAERGLDAEFAHADALALDRLGRTFQTVLDCGLFHTFDADERPGYVASLAAVTRNGGRLYVLCFSDEGPVPGPHPVSKAELGAAFSASAGWRIAAIESGRVHTRIHDNGAAAWLVTVERQDPALREAD